MKIILLAAGAGLRLKPFTEKIPKCLFKLGKEQTVIEHTIDIIRKQSEAEIIIVTGFQHFQIEQLITGVTFIYNPFYSVTNSIASLWFAREYLNDEIILINSDVVFQESMFSEIINYNQSAFVIMDSSRISDADYKVAVFNNRVVMMGKDLKKFSGEYVGITKLSKESASFLREKIESMISNDQIDEWYETALVSMILEDSFNLFYMDVPQYGWTEIDTSSDLLEAKKIYEKERIHNG